jgi:hypothetical protein
MKWAAAERSEARRNRDRRANQRSCFVPRDRAAISIPPADGIYCNAQRVNTLSKQRVNQEQVRVLILAECMQLAPARPLGSSGHPGDADEMYAEQRHRHNRRRPSQTLTLMNEFFIKEDGGVYS